MTMVFPIGAPNDDFANILLGQSYLAPLSTQQVGIYNVTFEPGCRTTGTFITPKTAADRSSFVWPVEVTIRNGAKPAQELRPGDVVNIPTGVKHWHGAAPDSWFSHLAVEVRGTKPPMNGWKPWTTQYILRQQARRSEYGKTEFNTGWDKVFPKSDKVDHKKVNLSQPLWHHTGGGYVHAEGHRGQVARHCRQRSVRCGKGAVLRSVCAENGGAWLLDDCLRPVLHRRERRYTPLCRFAGHQHRDFCAAVDFLSVQENVDPEHIAIIGICGWGGMAINAAAIDTRIKATAAMTMYDMTRVNANGYFDSEDSEQARFEKKKAMNAQRTEDYRSGTYALAGGVVDPLPEDAPQFVKDYYAYYKTPRGYHPRSLNSQRRLECDLLAIVPKYADFAVQQRDSLCRTAGTREKAHSRYFSETAYSKLTGDNKELLIIPAQTTPTFTIR